MAIKNKSLISEKDSYYVLRHKPTGLYVHERPLDWGKHNLEVSLLDNPNNQGTLGPFRIYPIVEDGVVSALAMVPGTDSEFVARQVNEEARAAIDWLNENDHFVDGGDRESDYEYSDFELLLVEVEYSVKGTQPVAANAYFKKEGPC
jgi:hypothetical protein